MRFFGYIFGAILVCAELQWSHPDMTRLWLEFPGILFGSVFSFCIGGIIIAYLWINDLVK